MARGEWDKYFYDWMWRLMWYFAVGAFFLGTILAAIMFVLYGSFLYLSAFFGDRMWLAALVTGGFFFTVSFCLLLLRRVMRRKQKMPIGKSIAAHVEEHPWEATGFVALFGFLMTLGERQIKYIALVLSDFVLSFRSAVETFPIERENSAPSDGADRRSDIHPHT